MFDKFKTDLKNAKVAEKIVKDVLDNMTDDYFFQDVSEKKECWHLGDIKVNYSYYTYCDRLSFDCNPLSYDEYEKYKYDYYIDVKDDSRIGDTRNILCEEQVYFRNTDTSVKGYMYSGYDYLAVVSKKENKIYILDFHLLQKHYKQGRKIRINHREQYNDVYLYSLDKAKDNGILMAVIEYDGDGGYYYPIELLYRKNNMILNTF